MCACSGFSILMRTKCDVGDQKKRKIIQGEDMLAEAFTRTVIRMCVCVCVLFH